MIDIQRFEKLAYNLGNPCSLAFEQKMEVRNFPPGFAETIVIFHVYDSKSSEEGKSLSGI